MVLVCNRPDLAVQLLDRWQPVVAAAAPSVSPPCARGRAKMPADPATLAGWALLPGPRQRAGPGLIVLPR